jgi:hypothetical protein
VIGQAPTQPIRQRPTAGSAARPAEDGCDTVARLVDARLSCYERATHTFLSTPGLVPAARPARRQVTAFLRGHPHPA